MTAPVLYSFRRCPYAMRARMALSVSGTAVRLREIVLRDKPQEMLAASPKGTVPVLVTENGVIDESRDVMAWALSQNDPEDWLASIDDPLIAACDGDFKHHLDRYKYATRYDDADPVEHRDAAMAFLTQLETRLSAQPYLCGDRRGFADIAIFPFIRQFRIADPGWFDESPLTKTKTWLGEMMAAPLFVSVMRKYPTWKASGEEFPFPEAPENS